MIIYKKKKPPPNNITPSRFYLKSIQRLDIEPKTICRRTDGQTHTRISTNYRINVLHVPPAVPKPKVYVPKHGFAAFKR